jgi:hypothetical protein
LAQLVLRELPARKVFKACKVFKVQLDQPACKEFKGLLVQLVHKVQQAQQVLDQLVHKDLPVQLALVELQELQ